MDKGTLKIIFVILGISSILGLGLYSLENTKKSSLTSTLNSFGYEIEGVENYSLQEIKKDKIAGVDVTEVSAKSSNNIIQALVFSDVKKEFTENYVQNRRNELAAVYTDIPAPYEGITAKEVNCPDKFTPDLNISNSEKTEFNLYSDDKNNIGACSNSTAQFRTKITMLYCQESNNLIEIRISKPIRESEYSEKIFCEET